MYEALFLPLEMKRWTRHKRTLLMQLRFKEQETELKNTKLKLNTQKVKLQVRRSGGGGRRESDR